MQPYQHGKPQDIEQSVEALFSAFKAIAAEQRAVLWCDRKICASPGRGVSSDPKYDLATHFTTSFTLFLLCISETTTPDDSGSNCNNLGYCRSANSSAGGNTTEQASADDT